MLADEEEEDDEVGEVLTLPLQAHHAMEKMEEFVHKVSVSSQLNKHRTSLNFINNKSAFIIQISLLPTRTLKQINTA